MTAASRGPLGLPTRRRWLLGAAALPAALMLSGCGAGIPFLGGSWEPGSCLPPSEELPEEVRRSVPEGIRGHLPDPSPDNRFEDSGLAVSPDGTLIAACESADRVRLELAEDYGVILWDTATGEVVRRITPSTTGPIAWHPDGSALAIAGSRHLAIMRPEGELRWHLIGHELPRRRIANILDVAYSPDGTQLASTSTDGSVRLWSTSDDVCDAGHILAPGARSDGSLSYSPDGSVLAVGGASSYQEGDAYNPPELWVPATGDRSTTLDDVEGVVFDLGYSGDGALLVLTHEPTALLVIDADGAISAGPVTASTWFADLAVGSGSKVALLNGDDELLLWDRHTGEETRLDGSAIERVCWSPDESVLYGLSREKGVMAWDGETWRQFALP